MLMMFMYSAEENNKDALVVAGKEIGLEVNADKCKYMIML
jgi:hypothetical protein